MSHIIENAVHLPTLASECAALRPSSPPACSRPALDENILHMR
jgi:hypothetical protein